MITIASGGLFPSNLRVVDGFPNLARRLPFSQEEIEKVTAISDAELRAVGIEPTPFDCSIENTEVPAKHWGHLEGWEFRRAWYYWVAEGPGIPPDIARKLHEQHGKAVRVDGHCCSPGPEYCRGFAVGRYHVDTPDGLKALADTIKGIVESAAVEAGV